MVTSNLSDAKELIGLAERMGIPTEDAVSRVVMRMAEPRRLEFAGESGRSVARAPWLDGSSEKGQVAVQRAIADLSRGFPSALPSIGAACRGGSWAQVSLPCWNRWCCAPRADSVRTYVSSFGNTGHRADDE